MRVFDGNNGHGVVATNAALSLPAGAWELVIMVDNSAAQAHHEFIWLFNDGQSNYAYLRKNSSADGGNPNVLRFTIGFGSEYTVFGAAITDGALYTIRVYMGADNSLRIAVNGTPASPATVTGWSAGAGITSANGLWIGTASLSAGNNTHFTGEIGEVMFFNRNLTTNERAAVDSVRDASDPDWPGADAVYHYPMLGDTSPEPNLIASSSGSMTMTSTTQGASHPVTYPSGEAPTAVSDFAADPVSAGQNDLDWTDPTDSGATSYTVQRAPDSAGSPGTYADLQTGYTTGLGGAMAYSDTTATPGTLYHYRVQGVNDAGSTPSNVVGPILTITASVSEPVAFVEDESANSSALVRVHSAAALVEDEQLLEPPNTTIYVSAAADFVEDESAAVTATVRAYSGAAFLEDEILGADGTSNPPGVIVSEPVAFLEDESAAVDALVRAFSAAAFLEDEAAAVGARVLVHSGAAFTEDEVLAVVEPNLYTGPFFGSVTRRPALSATITRRP